MNELSIPPSKKIKRDIVGEKPMEIIRRLQQRPDKRKAISEIAGKEYTSSINKQKGLIRERLNQAYGNSRLFLEVQDLEEHVVDLPNSLTDEVLQDISTTLVECSDILGVKIPQIGFFIPKREEEKYVPALFGINKGLLSSPNIYINLGFLTTWNVAYAAYLHSGVEQLEKTYKEQKKELTETFAEEMFHYYHYLKYPQTFLRTNQANEVRGEVYRSDRGEQLAKGFAHQYFESGNLPE